MMYLAAYMLLMQMFRGLGFEYDMSGLMLVPALKLFHTPHNVHKLLVRWLEHCNAVGVQWIAIG
jgi:hypothetical protein